MGVGLRCAIPAFIAAGIGISIAGCDSDEEGAPTNQEPPAATPGIANSGVDYVSVDDPRLTPEQEQRARELIEAEPSLRDLLAGGRYSAEFGAWVFPTFPESDQYELIGAAVSITLAEPIPSLEVEWPQQTYRPDYHRCPPEARAKYLPYREEAQTLRITPLTDLLVNVDLTRDKVVGIIAGPAAPGSSQSVTSLDPTPDSIVIGDERALTIFTEDARVGQIVAGRDYEGPTVASYRLGNHRFGSVSVQWADREDIEADWPIIVEQDRETGDYQVETIHFTANTVGLLYVRIDLDKGEVIAIHPETSD